MCEARADAKEQGMAKVSNPVSNRSKLDEAQLLQLKKRPARAVLQQREQTGTRTHDLRRDRPTETRN